MKHSQKLFLILGLVVLGGLAVWASQFPSSELALPQSAQDSRTVYPVESPVGLANPASVNCVKLGGTLQMEKNELGEYGVCYFEDNRACEEWALFRGECPVGGVKTTGYDTIDQKFCAWSGGSTLAVPDSKCTFKNGKVCSTLDFYSGKCSKE